MRKIRLLDARGLQEKPKDVCSCIAEHRAPLFRSPLEVRTVLLATRGGWPMINLGFPREIVACDRDHTTMLEASCTLRADRMEKADIIKNLRSPPNADERMHPLTRADRQRHPGVEGPAHARNGALINPWNAGLGCFLLLLQ